MDGKQFDIIGDIHGQYQKLSNLLLHMGYRQQGGVFSHKTRKVIFLGDFIDRGPQQSAVLKLVMGMVREGHALAVMGNHEFNALAFFTEDPDHPGTWLRPRTNKNIAQHLAFLNEFVGGAHCAELPGVLAFFRSLPLWLDLGDIRIIHACWDLNAMADLANLLDANNCLTEQALVASSRQDSRAFIALENLLKGPEVNLPNGVVFVDGTGIERKKMRLRWWFEQGTSVGQQVQDKVKAESQLKSMPPVPVVGYGESEPPLFIGHYWFSGKPRLLKANMMCLDYSAARNGPLVAYRWSGEQTLLEENICYQGLENEHPAESKAR